MLNRKLLLGILATAAVAIAGCTTQTPIRPYQSIASMGEAARQADLVVEGYVTATDNVEHLPAGDMWSNVSGKLGQDCVVKTRVTLDVTKVVKCLLPGTPSLGGLGQAPDPITFWFYGPCWHGQPDVVLGMSLPAVLTEGRRLRVYLDERDGQYWLIAHESLPPPSGVAPQRRGPTEQGPATEPKVRAFPPGG
jgi:hypothetical protein